MGRRRGRLSRRLACLYGFAVVWSLFWWLLAFAQVMQEAGRS